MHMAVVVVHHSPFGIVGAFSCKLDMVESLDVCFVKCSSDIGKGSVDRPACEFRCVGRSFVKSIDRSEDSLVAQPYILVGRALGIP